MMSPVKNADANELRTNLKRRKDAILGSVCVEGVEEKVKALLHCREDCRVEVSKWVTEVSNSAFRGLTREGQWTMKALANAWNQVSDDHDVRNDFSMWKSTDFQRHAVGGSGRKARSRARVYVGTARGSWSKNSCGGSLQTTGNKRTPQYEWLVVRCVWIVI